MPPPLPIDVTSELAVPIVLGHEVFGVINIEGRTPFEEEDISSIQVIADHLAVAIKNARLFDEAREAAVMRERQRLARDLHDSVTQVLSSISLMSQSLVAAWRKDAKEGERRAHRLEELSQLAFARDARAAARAAARGRRWCSARCRARLARGDRELRPEARAAATARGAGAGNARSAAGLHATTATRRWSTRKRSIASARRPLSNALRHSRCAAHLHPRRGAGREAACASKSSDDGSGFDATQPDAASCRPPLGGLGMQTMRERAAALGGATTINSAPGKGTRVIDRASTERPMSTRVQSPSTTDGPRSASCWSTITPSCAKACARCSRKTRASTSSAKPSNGDEATEMAARLKPNLVLMDLKMPGLPAPDAIRVIRAHNPCTQVLVLTSYVDDEQVQAVHQRRCAGLCAERCGESRAAAGDDHRGARRALAACGSAAPHRESHAQAGAARSAGAAHRTRTLRAEAAGAGEEQPRHRAST